MAEGIVYLDVDDEITSAASRIRTAPGNRVALVVPYGSRIATSRMNFRLLSREAVVSSHRLAIVAGDAASRSLAASAGLPVFATVSEYESSLARPRDEAGDGPAPAAAGLAASETVAATGPAPADTEEDDADAVPVEPPVPPRRSHAPKRPPVEAAAGAPAADRQPAPRPTYADERDDRDDPDGLPPLLGGRIRAPVLAVAGLLGLALIVLAVGAYLLLPSATIAVVPRREPIGPLTLTVSADPDATAVDPAAGVVPAVRIEVPVEAARTFTTTGKRVEAFPATGSVTFTNYDFTAQNTIVSGSVVSTEGGIRFRTLATVTLPPATLVIPTVVPSRRSVAVEAVKAGTEGNVPANSIRVVPQGENPETLRVNNPDPTSGGSRTETARVSKAEVDKAVTTVQADLAKAFDDAIAAGAGAPPEVTLFPTTAVLGAATPDVEPATLVGQEVETFDLRLSATGTVIAVDPSPIEPLVEARLAEQVGTGYRLVEGSTAIDVGEGAVGEDGQITFQATARAERVRIVEPGPLRELVKGMTATEARAALQPYGDATVELWPDWATTVTGVDARLTLTVDDGRAGGTGGTGGGPSTSPSTAPSSTP